MIRRCLLLGIFVLIIGSLLHADEGRKGQAGFQFLRIPVGARETAMGNTGMASSMGSSAYYWNPAGVAMVKGYETQFSNLEWFGGVSYQQFTGSAALGTFGAFAISVQYLSVPDIIETTEEAPDGTGATIAPYDIAVGFNFSKMMTDRVAFGMNFKYIGESIGLVTASAFAVDIGLTYKTEYQGLQLGFVIQNYGTKGEFTGSGLRRYILRDDGPPNQTPVPVVIESAEIDLPSSVQMGLSFLPYKSEQISLMVNADYVVNTFSANRTNFGTELGYDDKFFLRGGYFLNSDFNVDKTGQMTFGGGIHYPLTNDFTISVDYAYVDLGILNNAQYLTVGVQF